MPEPHSYDLCEQHASRLTAPKGWELVRYDGGFVQPAPSSDDLEALADAVREAARPGPEAYSEPNREGEPSARRGHLRVLPTPR